MIAGVVLATRMPDPGLLQIVLVVAVAVLAAFIAWRGMAWRWQVVLVCTVWGLAGLAGASWQLVRAPATLETGLTASLGGIIERLDGRQDSRLRVWLRVSDSSDASIASNAASILHGNLVRLSVRPDMLEPLVGSDLRVRVRIYPPPRRLLYGARDYAVQARIRGVVASGYIINVQNVGMPSGSVPLSLRLASLRQDRADRIAGAMDAPAGGIAAALLIGDRRYVSEDIYDLFRQSGLAHLLAISGLHMGLLCFGVIGFLRMLAALAPSLACRLPVHKIAALGGVGAGLGYVVLSGLSVSAIRAFLMAMLILVAWLIDRLGLTLRNVGLAAGVILLFNPMALFGAGFQLSFAATTGLVLWFETWRSRSADGAGGVFRSRILRWVGDLIIASLIASAATTPLTAQHFGTVTPWGVLANLAGIPLTGIWIMPSGLLVLVTQFMPVPDIVEGAALALMQTGIDLLVKVAALFADLPASPLHVTPPGAPLLVGLGLAGLLLLCWRLPKPVATGGVVAMLIAAALVLAMRPRVDAVLLGQGNDRLVMAGSEGVARLYASRTMDRLQLSSFHADAVMRALAQHRVVAVPPRSAAFSQQQLLNGTNITIVVSRRGLTRACRAGGDLVLALVAADYPCRDGTPLISLAGLPPGNFLLWVGRERVTARAANGQYFRISPVNRP